MYALRKDPSISEKISSGVLNVSNVARVETFIRREEKISGEKMSAEKKQDLFQQAENVSQSQLENVLTQMSPRATLRETVRPVLPELHEMKIYVSDDLLKKWNELQGWLAHGLKEPGSSSELFQKVVEEMHARVLRESVRPRRERQSQIQNKRAATPLTGDSSSESFSLKTPVLNRSRYVPISVQRQVRQRAGLQCEHRDPRTHQRCASVFKLEIHHRVPYARGGSSTDLKNLALYCRSHNQLQAYQDFGARKMNAAKGGSSMFRTRAWRGR